jgi:cyclopropane-fatty-acyl-phospholipid synthase
MALLLDLLEKDRLPDWLIRAGIRRLLAQRLREERAKTPEGLRSHQDRLVSEWRRGPIAVHEDDANAQHYEVPSRFFELVLGSRLKYSGGLWQSPSSTLDQSEDDMLALTGERAGIVDGMSILDLGCGWGSFSMYAAGRWPGSHITAISNSRTQRQFIEEQCQRRGIRNVRVITANMADCRLAMQVDRVVTVEMFEHMRNHEALLAKVACWMKPGARLFVHIFTHRCLLYLFEVKGD